MTPKQAEVFAQHWYHSWNSHNLDDIITHYADDIVFYSPVIIARGVNAEGKITNKADLQAYFKIGLDSYPDLHFDHKALYFGVDSLVLQYSSISGRESAECFRFNEAGLVKEVWANYFPALG